jgi:hypothetical protein
VDRVQSCWEVAVEATNLTSREVRVDWQKDETFFQVGGQWHSLRIQGLMTGLQPNQSRTFWLVVPRRAQACRYVIHYEHGPLWVKAYQWYIHGPLSSKLFTLFKQAEQRLPGHYKRLIIEVKVPPSAGSYHETNAA